MMMFVSKYCHAFPIKCSIATLVCMLVCCPNDCASKQLIPLARSGCWIEALGGSLYLFPLAHHRTCVTFHYTGPLLDSPPFLESVCVAVPQQTLLP